MLPRRRTLFWPVFLSTLTSDGLAQSENHRWSSNTATAKGWPTKTLGLSLPHLQNIHKKLCKRNHYLHIDQLLTQGSSYSQCSTLISHGEEQACVDNGPWARVTCALSKGGCNTCLAQYTLYTSGDFQPHLVHKMLLPHTSSFLEVALGPAFQNQGTSFLCH